MSTFYVGEEVEVIATGEIGTVEAVTKNFFRQVRIKLVGGNATYKESELRRVTTTTTNTTDDYTSDSTPDVVTQVVLANIYLDQMDDITQNVSELNNTIPEPETVIEKTVEPDVVVTPASVPESVTEKVSAWVEERQTQWEAPVSTESKSVDVDTSYSRSTSVDDSTSSWRSSSSDDSSSSWRSSSSDDNSSWGSSSTDSTSYDSSSSSSSSSDW